MQILVEDERNSHATAAELTDFVHGRLNNPGSADRQVAKGQEAETDGDALRQKKYGQRWLVETVNSMIKRLLGSALCSRKKRTQNRETCLLAITHNVMILTQQVFYRANKSE